MRRPRWRPNILPGSCKVATCGNSLDAGEGRMLPRPAGMGDTLTRQVLLCISCALATAPELDCGERFDALRADPPEGMDPSRYQRSGALFFARRWAALLSDDKGLGKTAQALIAIPDDAPVVVVCPASVKPGWQDECKLWRPELQATALSGRAAWSTAGGPGPGQVYILNYDILPPRIIRCRCSHGRDRHPTEELPEMVERGAAPADHIANTCIDCKCRRYSYSPPPRGELVDYLGIQPGTILIADECHHVKRSSSEKTKRFRELARAVDRVWGLSASPLENTEAELRGVYKSLGIYDAAFGKDKTFRRLFKSSREDKKAPSGAARSEIRQRRSWVELGRTAEQVGLELPPLRFRETPIVLTVAALAEVERLMTEAMATKRAWDMVKRGDLADPADGPAELAKFEREREMLKATAYADADIIAAIKECIELGPRAKVGADMSKLRKALAIAKMPAVVSAFVEEVENAETPGVMFSAHRIPVETVAARDGWGEISGRRSPAQRKRTLAAFKAGDLIGLSATIRAAGEGLNLQRCGAKFCTLVGFVDLDWTPERNHQAAKRIHRRGQERPCLITSFVANHPIDRHVAGIISVKRELIAAVTITGGL